MRLDLYRAAFGLVLGRRLPMASGTLAVDEVSSEVVIRRDRFGIPHIEARDDAAAWFGLGFCQAQDRAFQLEMQLRVAHGTLAELIGPDGLPIDRLARRVGFRRSATAQYAACGADVRETLEAFAAGLAVGQTRGARRCAHEFALLRARPSVYRPEDVIAVSQVLSFLLAHNWDVELSRLRILEHDGVEALVALDHRYPESLPVTDPPGSLAGPALDRLADDLSAALRISPVGGGSNNWVVASSRSATGRPLLAADPHLPPSLPSVWYLAHLHTPEWSIAGACVVGSPMFANGHNEHGAWGATDGFVDNTDLFVEEIGPDGRSVRRGENFIACERRREVIHVKGAPDVIEDVIHTSLGPIIGPALDEETHSVALRATWLQARPVGGLLRVHRARTFDEFRHAFDEWPATNQNMVWADTSGTIGWQLVGDAPRRKRGYGTMPSPGWEPDSGWYDDPVSIDELPHSADPTIGYIATANNKPVIDGTGPFLGVDWLSGYRAARIDEVLATRHDWDLDGFARLQLDVKSLPWREIRDVVCSAAVDDDDGRLAREQLTAWNGEVSADSPAAALFEFFLFEMSRRIVEAKAPHSTAWAMGRGFTALTPGSDIGDRITHTIGLLLKRPDGWFTRPWADEIADALSTAVRNLRAQHGDKPSDWAWGRVRTVTLQHPMGQRAPLDRVFNLGPFPIGGDSSTPAQATIFPRDRNDPTGNPGFVPLLRMVVDVGDWDRARFQLAGGQSGNPLSPHYDDLAEKWHRNESIPIAWTQAAVEHATVSTLRLQPTRA